MVTKIHDILITSGYKPQQAEGIVYWMQLCVSLKKCSLGLLLKKYGIEMDENEAEDILAGYRVIDFEDE